MRNLFISLSETAELIESGLVLFISGSEASLGKLPKGRWIGGTTAYFMCDEGGVCRDDKLFCTVFDEAIDCRTAIIPADQISRLTRERFAHGFACIVAPAFSTTHQRYAVEGPGLPNLYTQPVFGWVAGVHLDQVGKQTPKIFDGCSGKSEEDGLATLWIELPKNLGADLDIVNLFTAGEGDEISFPTEGFVVDDCTINGQTVNFSKYVTARNLDQSLPLVADYAGAMINVSVRKVDEESGKVSLYAPVVPGITYRMAKAAPNSAEAYSLAGKDGDPSQMMSCNCILNYLYSNLEGRSAGGFVGPVTFGEFAYILLNQTLSRLKIAPIH